MPMLTIGLPVYNGGRYLKTSVESILGQTFKDFRLIISDNASTDQTEDTCRALASADGRVEYHRQETNLGMAKNFAFVIRPGESKYFKLAAHDDLVAPRYLERCVDLLEGDPGVALAHCPSVRIDADDKILGYYSDLGLSGDRVSSRFWRILWTDNIYEIYGVMRSAFVEKAQDIGPFFGSERNFLADVVIQGDVRYVDEPLFARRDHDETLTAMHQKAKKAGKISAAQQAHDPTRGLSTQQILTMKARAYAESILRFPMSPLERARCAGSLADWASRSVAMRLFPATGSHRSRLSATHSVIHLDRLPGDLVGQSFPASS